MRRTSLRTLQKCISKAFDYEYKQDNLNDIQIENGLINEELQKNLHKLDLEEVISRCDVVIISDVVFDGSNILLESLVNEITRYKNDNLFMKNFRSIEKICTVLIKKYQSRLTYLKKKLTKDFRNAEHALYYSGNKKIEKLNSDCLKKLRLQFDKIFFDIFEKHCNTSSQNNHFCSVRKLVETIAYGMIEDVTEILDVYYKKIAQAIKFLDCEKSLKYYFFDIFESEIIDKIEIVLSEYL